MAFAFLVTYQAYYLIEQLGSARATCPHQIYLGTLAQSAILVVVSPVAGRLSDKVGRRKVFVAVAALVYAAAMLLIADAGNLTAIWSAWPSAGSASACTWRSISPWSSTSCPRPAARPRTSASSTSPAPSRSRSRPRIAPVILGLGGGSYAVLYAVAGACAAIGAAAIVPVRGVR